MIVALKIVIAINAIFIFLNIYYNDITLATFASFCAIIIGLYSLFLLDNFDDV